MAPEAVGSSANDIDGCREASASVRNGDPVAAAVRLDPIIAAPGFESVPDVSRHCALFLRGVAALLQKDWQRALQFLKASCATDHATPYDWQGRFEAAWQIPDFPDAIASATVLARRFPNAFLLYPSTVTRLAREAAKLPDSRPRFELLDGLFEARWNPGVTEPSDLWKDLALLSLERNDPARARRAVQRVTGPRALIAMRADRRFDDIVRTDPARFDVLKAQAAEIEQLRAAVRESPRSLQVLMELLRALSLARRYDEVLQLTDTVLARVEKARIRAPYDDVNERLIWVLNERSGALRYTGRWHEAVETLSRAARMPEGNSPRNVSQSLNLGFLFCELDRPKEALAAISQVTNLTDHGRQVREFVRLLAAAELQDTASSETALANLRREGDPQALEFALLALNRLDDAARLFLSRLADATLRNDVLYEAQDIVLPPAPPRVIEWRARSDAVIGRPEVQAAILEYGRIERYDLGPSPLSPSR